MASKKLIEKLKTSRTIRMFKPILLPAYIGVQAVIWKLLQLRTPFVLRKYDKLHLGCGPRRIADWANIDRAGFRNIIWDLRRRLPTTPGSIRFIYSEHFIEHISRAQALVLLRNCKVVLAKGGVVRVSTPNLRRLVDDYLAGVIPELPHATTWRPATTCVMMNDGMRLWGHQFVYDEAELILLLKEAGFINIRRMRWGESEHPELRCLETRPYFDDIIIEAT
jgi:predicted SAM-dependent methyltransferase